MAKFINWLIWLTVGIVTMDSVIPNLGAWQLTGLGIMWSIVLVKCLENRD